MYQDGAGEGSSRGNSSNISILLVDDDITTLHIVSAMLRTWSYEVVTAPNPIDALVLLRNGHPFDLVVTDLHMPGMNGLELQKLVHEEFDLPVIMMSSDDKESVILRSLEEGCVYYIVKPVSKEDIQMVCTFVAQSKQRRSSDVTFEDIVNLSLPEGFSTGQLMYGLDELDDLDSVTLNKRKKKTGKRERNVNDEEDADAQRERRLFAKRKSKVMWGNALHNHFLLAIKHLGFNKAAPKRILEYMNVPGLTRECVASHLQKYRMYLRRVAEKARLSKCFHEKINRTTLPFGIPTYEDDHRVQYAEYLKQQIYMTEMGLLAPPSQDALENLGANSHIGSSSSSSQPMTPNQVDNHSQNNNQLYGGSGQSRMLINNPIQNQRAPMQLVNGVKMLSQPNQGSGFGYQNVMNNGANLMDIDTQQGQKGEQLQKALNFTSNPFTYGNASMASSTSNANLMMTTTPMNNAAFGPSFGGATAQPTGVFGNNMNDGYNGMTINNDVNDITNGVRNVNLNGENLNGSSSSSRLENGNANQFAPRGFQPLASSPLLSPPNALQQNQYGVSSTTGFGNNDEEFDALMRNSMRSFKPVYLANVDDDMMVVNNLVMHQLNNNQLPSNQKKGRRDAPVGLSSTEYQDKFLASKATTNAQVHLNPNRASYGLAQQNTPFQLNPNRGAYCLAQPNRNPIANTPFQLNPIYGGFTQPNPNHVGNTHAHLNPNLSINGELHQRLNHMANPFGRAQGNPNYLRANSHQVQLTPPTASTVHFKRHLNPNPNDQVDLDPDRFLDNLEFVHAAPNQFGNPNLGYSSASNNNQIGLQMNPNANQGGNPSVFRFENAHNAEQPWIMGGQGGYNPHILNSSDYTSNNMFQSDGSSNLLGQQFAPQDLDDDFVNELMGYGANGGGY